MPYCIMKYVYYSYFRKIHKYNEAIYILNNEC